MGKEDRSLAQDCPSARFAPTLATRPTVTVMSVPNGTYHGHANLPTGASQAMPNRSDRPRAKKTTSMIASDTVTPMMTPRLVARDQRPASRYAPSSPPYAMDATDK